jgi:hypothetical protein
MLRSRPLIAKPMAQIRSGERGTAGRPEQRAPTAAPWPERGGARRSSSNRRFREPKTKLRAGGARGGNGELTPRQNRRQGQLGDDLRRVLADPRSLRGSATRTEQTEAKNKGKRDPGTSQIHYEARHQAYGSGVVVETLIRARSQSTGWRRRLRAMLG